MYLYIQSLDNFNILQGSSYRYLISVILRAISTILRHRKGLVIGKKFISTINFVIVQRVEFLKYLTGCCVDRVTLPAISYISHYPTTIVNVNSRERQLEIEQQFRCTFTRHAVYTGGIIKCS